MSASRPADPATRRLANGLVVHALPDPEAASVAVVVGYRVGARDDPAGRSGFAHLFEHLMFKATRNMPAEFIDRLTDDVGGYNNAYTADDFTVYYDVAPPGALERLLWAEAERMGGLVLDDAAFGAERETVKEELYERIFAAPYGRFFDRLLPYASFDVHPYGRPAIGEIEDLDAATAEEARAFHAAYYRPDNATLAVAGAFDPADLDAVLARHFGGVRAPATPLPRLRVVEPARGGPRRHALRAAEAPSDAVALIYPGLAAADPRQPTLAVLDAVLSRGESSRLFDALVRRADLASETFSFAEPTREPGVWTLGAILSADASAEDGLAALEAAAAALARDGPTPAELAEAKNELRAERLEARETPVGRALDLVEAAMRFDDPADADRQAAAIAAVTASQARDLARALLDPARATAVLYGPGVAEGEPPRPPVLSTPTIPPAPGPPPARAAAPAAPPPLRPSAPPVDPPIVEARLANGLRVLVAPRPRRGLASFVLRLDAGAVAEPAGAEGLAGLAAFTAVRGAGARDGEAVAAAVEALGASLHGDADEDSAFVCLDIRADLAADGLALLAEAAQAPRFAADEAARARRLARDDLDRAFAEPAPLAERAAARALYGEGPYGRLPTATSLKAATPQALRSFHDDRWRAGGATLAVAGDLDPEAAFALAEAAFGGWRGAAPPPLALPPSPASPGGAAGDAPRAVFVDLPGAAQAAVVVATLGPARGDPDYAAAALATAVLGGGFSARLNTEIRVRRGLSYGASAGLGARRGPSPILAMAQTRPPAAVDVARLILDGFAGLAAAPPAPDELTARRESLLGAFGRRAETAAGLAASLAALGVHGLPVDAFGALPAALGSLTAEDVVAIAKTQFDPARAVVVICADGDRFEAAQAAFPGIERYAAGAI